MPQRRSAKRTVPTPDRPGPARLRVLDTNRPDAAPNSRAGVTQTLAPSLPQTLCLPEVPSVQARLRVRMRGGCRRAGQSSDVEVDDLEGAENLCDLVVLVQEASGEVASADAEGLEVDDVVGQAPGQRGLAEGAVRAVLVVEALVLAQQSAQLRDVPDQGAWRDRRAHASRFRTTR